MIFSLFIFFSLKLRVPWPWFYSFPLPCLIISLHVIFSNQQFSSRISFPSIWVTQCVFGCYQIRFFGTLLLFSWVSQAIKHLIISYLMIVFLILLQEFWFYFWVLFPFPKIQIQIWISFFFFHLRIFNLITFQENSFHSNDLFSSIWSFLHSCILVRLFFSSIFQFHQLIHLEV